MVNAIDCATKLNATSAKALASAGVTHVGRYLDDNWKALELDEVNAIKAAGLKIFSIFEKAATKVAYFTAAQGKADALEAIKFAKSLGQPDGTAIYFTVDYDAQQRDFSTILTYFMAVKANLKGYKVGAYGSYSVLTYLHANQMADYYFQTYAWSGGKRCSFLHVYQYQNGKTIAGINVDFDNLEKPEIGAWPVELKAESINNGKSPNMYRLIKGGDIFDTSVPVNVFVKLKDSYRVDSIPDDKKMSAGMIRLVNANGDVIDTSDISKVNALIASGYVVVFHS
jgi:hypothetical protein